MANGRPLVSAIVPTYNRAHVICEAIESIFAQTYPHIEVIVVDDGSNDDTLTRLKKYGDRIRVVSQANAGPAAARNRGITLSHGELIAFLDSDDIWLPTKIERQVALLERAGKSVPCCLCNIMMQWEDSCRTSFDIALLKPAISEGIWTNADEGLASRFVMFNQAIVIRREVLERIGGFYESIRFLEDYELALRLSLEGPWAFIGEPLVVWRKSMTESLYKCSQRQELCITECIVEALERHLIHTGTARQYATVHRLVGHELNRNRWWLRAARLRKREAWQAAAAANILALIQRLRRAALVRSPWFPEMNVVPVERRGNFPAASSLIGEVSSRSS